MSVKKPTTTRREITMDLRCDLTDPEKLAVGAEMAKANNEMTAAEERKQSVTTQIKAEIDAAKSTVSAKGRLLSNGYEYRPVKCEEVKDFDALSVFTVRLDTGEEVNRRPMNEDERQIPLQPEA